MAAPVEQLRVVEFYSGVGGMHYALILSEIPSTVVAAVDINEVANKVYKHNFPDINLLQRNIQSVSLKDFIKWDADVFLMSPPCQPFTRVGLKGDKSDPRTSSFLYLLQTLPQLTKKPGYILVENVKGFESSDTRNELVDVLKKCHYSYKDSQSETALLLLAKQQPLIFKETTLTNEEKDLLNHQILSENVCCHSNLDKNNLQEVESTPGRTDTSDISDRSKSEADIQNTSESMSISNLESQRDIGSKTEDKISPKERNIKEYLEALSQESFEDYAVPDKTLLRFGRVMESFEEDERTCCFTKAYGHYVEGTGSFLQHNNSLTKQWAFEDRLDSNVTLLRLQQLSLRYFTPREVANFHCFPKEFRHIITGWGGASYDQDVSHADPNPKNLYRNYEVNYNGDVSDIILMAEGCQLNIQKCPLRLNYCNIVIVDGNGDHDLNVILKEIVPFLT
ncbi:putative tRNA (cytosine(38)-C(5))-methyltransferase-like [Apostichopus japonicus]|uniref:Putative tRNA (Cytosine(38)-C(5))-methyltransferase-like n=1 Tax=Stichopus japonicus TaxID=307972 RepID=A0A2G8JCF9_STIJA|nr:putative tRNA (cytosine(38)-C(5))-methyltransferase-like [Apostichopus japonicus]